MRDLGLEGGCSAFAWETEDGKHLWGRNYDFDRLAQGTAVQVLPRGTAYGISQRETGRKRSRYACAGVGLFLEGTPILYEGMNEKGLMGGQLYFREHAVYQPQPAPGREAVQPPFLVTHLLAQCATVEEAAACLEELSLVDEPLLGTVPPLHWCFSDRTGEMAILEPGERGAVLYRSTLGVMTNSPGYPWHKTNLLNFAGLRDLDYPGASLGEEIPQCYSGSGAQGLPGDWSSPSRFVRLCYLRKFALRGKDEAQGVARLFRILESAAFPLGAVRVSHQSPVTQLDRDVLPYDFTVYSTVYCAESLGMYWTTYDNQTIRRLDFSRLLDAPRPQSFPLEEPLGFEEVRPVTGEGD